MLNFIELTSRRDGSKIFINPHMIGHVYQELETGNYGPEKEGKRVITVIGMLTHNNGGFKVLESVEDVLHKIHFATV